MFQVQITRVQNKNLQIPACMTLTQVPPAAQANRCTESAILLTYNLVNKVCQGCLTCHRYVSVVKR